MKLREQKLIVILLFCFGLTRLQAQTIYVNESDGIQTSYILNNISKMDFSSGNLTITKTDNSSGVYVLSELRYLSFEDFVTGINESGINENQHQNIKTYPNPVISVFYVDLSGTVNQAGIIYIINLYGRVEKIQPVIGKGVVSVDIGQLPNGIYLCRYSSGKEISTVKIIKQ